MVDQQTIDRVRANVMNWSDTVLESEFEGFLRHQPAVCAFVMDLMSTRRQSVHQLALYLAYVVYKALLTHGDRIPQQVTDEGIADACSESKHWVDRMSEAEPHLSSLPNLGREPCLINYVISEVDGAINDGLELNEDDKGAVFFVLAAVVVSLSARPN